ncbi:4596_t:CDS:2 [Acaulospora colombiana]|uniref:4596_t:CDS:1 n=1 Tax=Acaulospora colombiana TaxID=27376 RepID=A0ACA9PJ25_9GLOM|nr:4596_t:CDS:2 [Acaulospora colombiana]
MAFDGYSNNSQNRNTNGSFPTPNLETVQCPLGSPSAASDELDPIYVGFLRVIGGGISPTESGPTWFPEGYWEQGVAGPSQPSMLPAVNSPNSVPPPTQVEVSKRLQKIGQDWACQQCGAMFKRKDRAVAHVHQHLGLYKFPCNGQCGNESWYVAT